MMLAVQIYRLVLVISLFAKLMPLFFDVVQCLTCRLVFASSFCNYRKNSKYWDIYV